MKTDYATTSARRTLLPEIFLPINRECVCGLNPLLEFIFCLYFGFGCQYVHSLPLLDYQLLHVI
jgi:hypothetical protein